MPRVIHVKMPAPPDAVFIGRPGPWGNPFVMGRDGTRDEVIAKYEAWLLDRPDMLCKAMRELRGKTLVCYCAPQRCHGDVLMKFANQEEL